MEITKRKLELLTIAAECWRNWKEERSTPFYNIYFDNKRGVFTYHKQNYSPFIMSVEGIKSVVKLAQAVSIAYEDAQDRGVF